MPAVHLDKESFFRLVGSYRQGADRIGFVGARPVVIDFYASWCAPCRMLSPLVEEIADEYKGRLDVYKVDVDEEDDLATLFEVRSIPTLVFISKDGILHRTQGAINKMQLHEMLGRYLV